MLVDGAQQSLGGYARLVDAARAFQLVKSGVATPQEMRRHARALRKVTTTSKYIGVTQSLQDGRWQASVPHELVGRWNDERAAALARDRAIFHFGLGSR